MIVCMRFEATLVNRYSLRHKSGCKVCDILRRS